MKGSARSNIFITVSLLLFVCSAVNVSAAEVSVEEEWKFGAELYFWGASIAGQSANGSDIDVDVGDIFSSVEFAFMGTVGASKGKWSLAADVIYLNAEDSDAIAPGLKADVELTNWVITPVVGYNLVDTGRSRLDILGGARYLYIKADLSLDALGLRADDSGSNWDAVIGARGAVDLTEKWYLFGYLDIGTGESDLTWQGLGGVGYRFKWFDLVGVYRYLRWNFDDNKTLDNLYLHGPAAGIRFLF
ncbi:MAG: hypothetical protein AB1Z20_23455 [Desulfobacterales bacterium]|jgi:hypothetical protein